MTTAATSTKPRRLVLVGAGHTHLSVIRAFKRVDRRSMHLTLVSPSPHATYSGMVPGVLAGQYRPEEAQIDICALTNAIGAEFLCDSAIALDPARRVVTLRSGSLIHYDFLSLDIGSQSAAGNLVSTGAPVVKLRPINDALRQIDEALAAYTPGSHSSIIVVGAGAAGIEMAFALAARTANHRSRITICDPATTPLASRGCRLSRLLQEVMQRHGIRFRGRTTIKCVESRDLELTDGTRLQADLVLWATGASAPSLLSSSGLPVDRRGFILVNSKLRCPRYPELFAAGDCATLSDYPDTPKAGVYAVRQGPILAQNLAAALHGTSKMADYIPQKRFLALLNTCDGKAIMSYGGLTFYGSLAWRLKNGIDRAFIRKYNPV